MKIVILGTKARYQRYLPDLPFARAQEPVYLDKSSSEEEILAAAGDAEVIFVDAITPVSTKSATQAAGHSILLVLSFIFGSFVHDKDILPAGNHRT